MVDEALVKWDKLPNYILGFQNQRSTVHNLKNPLFEIIKGIGSYPNSKGEGLHYNNFYGTYIIGPILVRNPKLLKYFTKEIILSKLPNFKFKSFQLSVEQKAHKEYINRYYNTLQK